MVSIFQNGYANEGFDVEIEDVLWAIWKGRWEQKIGTLRRLHSINKSFYDSKKVYLPGVTFSGTFKRRLDEALDIYSNVICVDIDYHDPDQLKRMFYNNVHIYSAFASPSNKGLKILIKTDNKPENHKEAVLHLIDYFKENYNIKIDKSCKNVSRLCFISYDPKLFFNRSSEIFKVDVDKYYTPPVLIERVSNTESPKDVPYIIDLCYRIAEGGKPYINGNRNNHIFFLSSLLNERGVYEHEALDFILKQYPNIPEDCLWSAKYIYRTRAHNFNTFQKKTYEPKAVKLE